MPLMCDVQNVRRSGYYALQRRQPSARQQEYNKLIPIVRQTHKVTNGTYGARRKAKEIRKSGTPCGRAKPSPLRLLGPSLRVSSAA